MNSSMISAWLLLTSLQLISLCTLQAQFDNTQDPVDSIRNESYLILAAENTPLQRFLTGRKDEEGAALYLLIDGQRFFPEGELDVTAIDWRQLSWDLQSVFERQLLQNIAEPPKRSLMIRVYYTDKPRDQEDFVGWLLEGFARRSADFKSVRLTSSFSNGGEGLWEKYNSVVEDRSVLVNRTLDETPRENEYVQVYPVRTFFSRLLASNADCVVVIKPKFSNEFDGGLPRSIRTSMSVFSRQLELEGKGRVAFSLSLAKDSEAARDWFIEQGAREMARLLGFQRWTVTVGYQ